MRKKRWIRDCAILAVLACLTVFWGIGSKSLWLDETLSIANVTTWPHLWTMITKSDPYQAGYLLLLFLWKHGGMDEAYLRSLSALVAVATVLLTYGLGNALFNRRIGILTAFLLAMNMFLIRYGQEVRGEIMLLCFATASSYCFVRYIFDKKKIWLVGYIVSSIIAFYAHHFALFTLGAQYLSLLWMAKSKEKRNLFIVLPIIVLFFVPLLLAASSAVNWIPRPTVTDVVDFFVTIAGGHWLLFVFSVPLVFIGMTRKITWKQGYLLLLFSVPVVGAFILSFVIAPMFISRYLIATLFPWNMFVVLGIDAIHSDVLKKLSIGIVIFLSILSLVSWYRGKDTLLSGFLFTNKEDWRGASYYVLTHTRKNDAVIFYTYLMEVPYSYYQDRFLEKNPSSNIPEIVRLTTSPYSLAGQLPPPDDQVLHSLPAGYSRVWFVHSHDQSHVLGRDVQSAHIASTLVAEYPYSEDHQFFSVSVALYYENP